MVAQQGSASASLHDLGDWAAHVEVNHVRACSSNNFGSLGHRVRILTEELDRDRMLIRVDSQHLLAGLLIAVLDGMAADHFGDEQASAEPAGLKAEEPIADSGQWGQRHPVGYGYAADLKWFVEVALGHCSLRD
jgi:hypothetical protein